MPVLTSALSRHAGDYTSSWSIQQERDVQVGADVTFLLVLVLQFIQPCCETRAVDDREKTASGIGNNASALLNASFPQTAVCIWCAGLLLLCMTASSQSRSVQGWRCEHTPADARSALPPQTQLQ